MFRLHHSREPADSPESIGFTGIKIKITVKPLGFGTVQALWKGMVALSVSPTGIPIFHPDDGSDTFP
jgi:hypothetical protein